MEDHRTYPAQSPTRSTRSVSLSQLYSPRPSLLGRQSAGEPSTPPLSSPNSSTTGERATSAAPKLDELAASLQLTVKKHDQKDSLKDKRAPHADEKDETDAMEDVQEYGDEIENSAEETVVFPSYPNQPPTSAQSSSGGGGGKSEFGRGYGSSFDFRASSMDLRHSSSTHSRSSSISVGSHQSSSIYGGPIDDPPPIHRAPAHSFSTLSHHAHHPPRTTPARRGFPSLRHALSHPALHTSHSSTGASSTHYHPYASPGSAPATHLAHPIGRSSGGCCTQPGYGAYPSYGMPRSAGPELAPVCPSRTGTRVTSVAMARPHSAKEESVGSSSLPSANSSSNGWASDWSRLGSTSAGGGSASSVGGSRGGGGVGFEEALGALETVMRFLQEQPTSFATPRDYMVVGELFGKCYVDWNDDL